MATTPDTAFDCMLDCHRRADHVNTAIWAKALRNWLATGRARHRDWEERIPQIVEVEAAAWRSIRAAELVGVNGNG